MKILMGILMVIIFITLAALFITLAACSIIWLYMFCFVIIPDLWEMITKK
jgi:hypothetical protein